MYRFPVQDSTAVLALARKRGTEAFFIDTGIEFPETVAFVEAQGVEIVRRGGDFWAAVRKAGPPAKDRSGAAAPEAESLKLHLAETGPVSRSRKPVVRVVEPGDLDITIRTLPIHSS